MSLLVHILHLRRVLHSHIHDLLDCLTALRGYTELIVMRLLLRYGLGPVIASGVAFRMRFSNIRRILLLLDFVEPGR